MTDFAKILSYYKYVIRYLANVKLSKKKEREKLSIFTAVRIMASARHPTVKSINIDLLFDLSRTKSKKNQKFRD